jgi:transposase
MFGSFNGNQTGTIMKLDLKLEIKRLDHLGIVAGTIKDLGIIELVNESVGHDSQENVSVGQVTAAMILNGLGFVSKPLMLTPQYFETKPLNILLGENVIPEHLNRHKLGRVLDSIFEYGCEKLFNGIALIACTKENVDMQYGHTDTTSYSLTGNYDSDSDTEEIKVTYGHSKDMRQDLKQIVQELVTAQDGGIPLMTKTCDGNASDTIILRQRAESLKEAFLKSDNRSFSQQKCLVADCKLYTEETAKTLNQINFITRVPSNLKREKAIITSAIKNEKAWFIPANSNGYKFQEFFVDQFDIKDQRWIVIYSEQAYERVKKTLTREVSKERNRIKKELFHLQAARFACENDAKKELKLIVKKWKYHRVAEEKLTSFKRSETQGRPAADAVYKLEWQIEAEPVFDQSIFDKKLDQRSCFVLATNISAENIPMQDVLMRYKHQDKTEKGFAFLKSPEFFASSLFLKKPSRIEALLTIMVLSLLVYSIAQRRLRQQLELAKKTIANQINIQTKTPTMRWIFQLFEGVNYVAITKEDVVHYLVEGLTDLRKFIISLFSENVQRIYQVSGVGG